MRWIVLYLNIYRRARLSSFFLESKEAVTGIFIDNTVFRKIAGSAFAAFGSFGEEINRLWLAAAQSNFLLVQIVGDAFTVSMFVGH